MMLEVGSLEGGMEGFPREIVMGGGGSGKVAVAARN